MRNTLIRNALSSGGFISVNKYVARRLSLHAAIILGELIHKQEIAEQFGKMESEEYFKVYRDDLEKATSLSAKLQRPAEKLLEAHKLIRVKSLFRDGTLYKLNETEIEKFLAKDES